jgi:hypothetical protein
MTMSDVRRALGSDNPDRTDAEREELVTGAPPVAGTGGLHGDDPADAERRREGADPAQPRDDQQSDTYIAPQVISPPD